MHDMKDATRKYELTRKAINDMGGIWEYTVRVWSLDQANKYFNVMHNTFQMLADFPGYAKCVLSTKIY